MVFSDGVFYDAADRLFKMWYMAGYQQHTALAVSRDGITWTRPTLAVVPGTNIVFNSVRDSSTVWLDVEARDASERFKMAAYDLERKALRAAPSGDGIHWREVGQSGPCGDRSTFFRNPFRGVWVFSLRADRAGHADALPPVRRVARPSPAHGTTAIPPRGSAPIRLDIVRDDLRTAPQLYNVDAVAYESVMLGLFTIYRGEQPGSGEAQRRVRRRSAATAFTGRATRAGRSSACPNGRATGTGATSSRPAAAA